MGWEPMKSLGKTKPFKHMKLFRKTINKPWWYQAKGGSLSSDTSGTPLTREHAHNESGVAHAGHSNQLQHDGSCGSQGSGHSVLPLGFVLQGPCAHLLKSARHLWCSCPELSFLWIPLLDRVLVTPGDPNRPV